jgi:hypothetical protein
MNGQPHDSFMSAPQDHCSNSPSRSAVAAEIASLVALGPEAQGFDIDETLLLENLRLSPCERIATASELATQIEQLQSAVKTAAHA